MNPLLTGAVALALGPAAMANGTEPSNDWLGLDQELNAVASPVALQGGGVTIGALFRGAYVSTSGDDFTGFADGNGDGDADDQLGMVIDDAELWYEGSIEQYSWRISVDFGNFDFSNGTNTGYSPYFIGGLLGVNNGGTANLANTGRMDVLEDAYVDWNFDEDNRFALRLGHFVFPTTFTTTTSPGRLLFLGRSTNGEFFHQYDLGAMVSGDYDVFQWHLGVLNGADGTGDEHKLAARAIYNLGAGASGEGALGADEDFAASLGFSYVEDGALDDGEVISFDVVGTVGQFSFGGEFSDYGDDHAALGFGAATGLGYGDGGPSVYSVNAGYLINEQWEVAARYEDLDDDAETTITSFGVNFYQAGHNAKWQLLYMDVASDVTQAEGSVIAVGVTVGASHSG